MNPPTRCPISRKYVPPVEGDVLRRRPVCGRVLVEVVARQGGTTFRDIEWLLGLLPGTAHVAARDGIAKLRRALPVVLGEVA